MQFSSNLIYINLPFPIQFVRWPITATPKERSSRQKKEAYAKRKKLTPKQRSSRQKKKAHAKRKKAHAKRKRLTPKDSLRQKKETHAKRKKKLAANSSQMVALVISEQ